MESRNIFIDTDILADSLDTLSLLESQFGCLADNSERAQYLAELYEIRATESMSRNRLLESTQRKIDEYLAETETA